MQGKGKVHVCNSEESVAFHYADKSILAPLIYSDEYIPFLLNYCKQNHIDILISLFDIDLLILAKNKDLFEKIGTKVIVSDKEIIQICNDKWETYKFLLANNFYVPKTFISIDGLQQALNNNEVSFPIIVKPRFGCGSLSIATAYDKEDLDYLYKKSCREINSSYLRYESCHIDQKVLFQEFLVGKEYGADIINDLHGKIQNIIIREKIAMRSGETDIATIVDIPKVKSELFRLGNLTKHIANMDCDIFIVDDKPYILELNARFGGGYPFSHAAGCDLPYAIVQWCKGEPLDGTILEAKNGIKAYKELIISTDK